MKQSYLFFLALLSSSFILAVQGNSCFKSCKFSFCPDQAVWQGGVPDVPFTNRICDPTGKIKIGSVDSTKEALVRRKFFLQRISRFNPPGLLQNYSPSFFKSYRIPFSKFSGVGHETPQQNQADFISFKCIILPLERYQILDKKHNVIDNVSGKNPLVDCVAFRVNI